MVFIESMQIYLNLILLRVWSLMNVGIYQQSIDRRICQVKGRKLGAGGRAIGGDCADTASDGIFCLYLGITGEMDFPLLSNECTGAFAGAA